MSRTDELKQLLRNAPTIEATFADLDARLAKVSAEYHSLKTTHTALAGQMAAFASARAELGIKAVENPETKTGEPAPAPSPADKPKSQGNKK